MIYVAARQYDDFREYVENNSLDYINCEYIPSTAQFSKSKFNYKTDKIILLSKWRSNKNLKGLEKELYLAGVDMEKI